MYILSQSYHIKQAGRYMCAHVKTQVNLQLADACAQYACEDKCNTQYACEDKRNMQYAYKDTSLNLQSAHERTHAMPEVDGPIKQGTAQPPSLHPGKTEDF